MSHWISRIVARRLAACLLVGSAVLGFASGCDSASQPGSVDLGAKADAATLTPGTQPPSATPATGKAKGGKPRNMSIKEHPQG